MSNKFYTFLYACCIHFMSTGSFPAYSQPINNIEYNTQATSDNDNVDIYPAAPQMRIVPDPDDLADLEILFEASLEISMGLLEVKSCGSSILSARKLLTAAHCVEDLVEGDFKGTAHYGWHKRTRKVTFNQFIMHPDYNVTNTSRDAEHDIALIILNSDIHENLYTQYADIDWEMVQRGDIVQVFGRGIHENFRMPNNLEKMSLRVKWVNRRNFFATGLTTQPDRVSKGDSGGPVVKDGKLVGVTVGIVPRDHGIESIFSMVAVNQDFILQDISMLQSKYEPTFFGSSLFYFLLGITLFLLLCFYFRRLKEQNNNVHKKF